ncbi:MAG: ABC transporter substrate-binding protein [Candidatus Methanomethylophilaceae archaeon]|nr:ABC transporter substrate-binding protein [Candidatus Methanomethylophilaceae archaeon]
MEKKTLIVCAVVAVVAIAAIAAAVALSGEKGGPKDIEDMRGRQVTIPKDVDSILAINCCSLELVSYFDALDKVKAIDKDDALNPNKPYTQAFKDKFSSLAKVDRAKVEEIIALDPSIIITSTTDVSELNNLQQQTGIPVFAINADLEFGDEAWFDQITKLGTLFDEKKRAKEINSGIKSIIDDIKSASAPSIKGYTCGMMFYGQGNFLKVSGDWLPFIYSGVKNVMPSSSAGVGKQPYVTDIETVMGKQIDIIFIDNSNLQGTIDQMLGFMADQGLDNDAIENDEIYSVFTYKMWGTQFDAVLLNCLYVAKTVNGSAYSWTFEDKADEVLHLLYRDAFDYQDLMSVQKAPAKQVI